MSDAFHFGKAFIARETEKAFQVTVTDKASKYYNETFWIPKSVVHDDSEVYEFGTEHDEGELVVKSWWAEREGYGETD